MTEEALTVTTVIRSVGVAFILVGLLILVAPESVLSSLNWESRSGQFIAAVVRIAFGVLFLVAASRTRYPTGMQILGVAFVLPGLAYSLIPDGGWTDLIQWLNDEGQGFYRLGGTVGGALAGGLLIQASKPDSTTA